jgi:hypothetical protein
LDDLLDRLKADPAYAAKWKSERHKRIQRNAAQNQIDEAPVVEALRAAGVEVTSVWDLANTSVPYPKALPVLLEHLPKPYSSIVREGIARALAVLPSRPAWRLLVEEYRNAPASEPGRKRSPVKDGLAVALSATVTSATLGELIALAKDPSNGTSRLLLLRGIRRSRLPLAKHAIVDLANDPQLAKEIASWRRT